MCFRDDRTDYLNLGLTARIAIDTLVGFYDGEKIWHASELGISIINETLHILRVITKIDTTTRIYQTKTEHFTTYDQMAFLLSVVNDIKWDTWESDLEQWLTNKDRVLDYFMAVERRALGHYRQGGCF